MTAPLVKPHTTYEQLCEMPSDGNRWELIEGEAYMSPSPSLRHQELVLRIAFAFGMAVRDGGRVFVAPLDTVLAPATALQPDVIFVRRENAAVLRDVIRGSPDLVVEVLSPSNAAFDRGPKLEAYARHGVGECWLVDDEATRVEIHRLERGTRAYGRAAMLAPGEVANTPLIPGLALDVTALFAD
jgi:Uma2 family endonuclease